MSADSIGHVISPSRISFVMEPSDNQEMTSQEPSYDMENEQFAAEMQTKASPLRRSKSSTLTAIRTPEDYDEMELTYTKRTLFWSAMRSINVLLFVSSFFLYTFYTAYVYQSASTVTTKWRLQREHISKTMKNDYVVISDNDFCGRLARDLLKLGRSAKHTGVIMYNCLFITEPHAISPHGFNQFFYYNASGHDVDHRIAAVESRIFDDIYEQSLKSDKIPFSGRNVRIASFISMLYESLDFGIDFLEPANISHIIQLAATKEKSNSYIALRYDLAKAIKEHRWNLMVVRKKLNNWFESSNRLDHDRFSPRTSFLKNFPLDYSTFSYQNQTESIEKLLKENIEKIVKGIADLQDELIETILKHNEKISIEKMWNQAKTRRTEDKWLKLKERGFMKGYWSEGKSPDLETLWNDITLDNLNEKLRESLDESFEHRNDEDLNKATLRSFLLMDQNGNYFFGGGGLSNLFGAGMINENGFAYDCNRTKLKREHSSLQPIILLDKNNELKSVTLIASSSPTVGTQIKNNQLVLHVLQKKTEKFLSENVILFPNLLVDEEDFAYRYTAGFQLPGECLFLECLEVDWKNKEDFTEIDWFDLKTEILSVDVKGGGIKQAYHVRRSHSGQSILT